MEKEVEVKEKKHIKIAGITLWRIVAYFIIYSVAGFIIETIFGVLTKGVLESRKKLFIRSFLQYIWTWSSFNDIAFAKV